jgi:hypothetical protein
MIQKEQKDIEETIKEKVASDNGLQEKIPCMEPVIQPENARTSGY